MDRSWATSVRRTGTALCLTLSTFASAGAAQTDYDGLVNPIVRVNVQRGAVRITTSNQPSIQIDAPPEIAVKHSHMRSSEPDMPLPILEGSIGGPRGTVTLAQEEFVVPSVPTGDHDLIVVKGALGDVTLRVPSTTTLIIVQKGTGRIVVSNYHGAFVARIRNGVIAIDHGGGVAFVQALRGPIIIRDSQFEHLRTRTAFGPQIFEGCSVRQIEATSINGSIVFDNGNFEPGLARFDSTHGNIALGVAGPAQIGARSDAGGVFTQFDRGTQVDRSEREASASVGGGGPVVTATSETGSVFLYSGALRTHRALPMKWRAPLGTLGRARPRNHK